MSIIARKVDLDLIRRSPYRPAASRKRRIQRPYRSPHSITRTLDQNLLASRAATTEVLGLEQAGFRHEALVEIEPDFAKTLKLNRPTWDVRATDMNEFDGRPFKGIDLMTAGLPCPPFSVAGKQLGENDERNLFPAALRLIDEMKPKAVMIENVRGFLSAVFEDYRIQLRTQLEKLGYKTEWRLLNASDFGVSQLRPRVIIVAIRKDLVEAFEWPEVQPHNPPSVGALLKDLMAENGWRGVDRWVAQASDIAPTLVGGSKKHGGPDLGPTRARRAWATMDVEGKSLANSAPERDFVGMPRLTLRMVARLQGFPYNWQFYGGKTTSYRQIGNAFPPPVAKAVAANLKIALSVQKCFAVKAA